MRVDFYHVDAFELANYEPVWRALRGMGVDANLVAVPGNDNAAAAGWFNFECFQAECQARGLPFVTAVEPGTALGVTTQNADIVRDYSRRVRLMYGPVAYPHAWALQRHAVQPFDAVLVHGPAYAERFGRWLQPDQLPQIGYPRYDDLFAGRIDRPALRERWKASTGRPVLAFLPTWGDNTAFDTIFPALLALRERFQILVRPHHCTVRMEPQRMQQMRDSGLMVLDNAFDIVEVICGSDLVVSDVRSGSLFEAAMCDRPTVGLVRADSGDAEGWLAEQGLARITALCADPAKLEEALDRAFASALAGARRDWADSQVSFRDGTAAVKAALALVQLAERGRVGVAVPRSYERKVSVVLPTYNHITFLPQAVAAVQAQTYTDFEFIIVNDGSTDGTADFLATLRDPRIRVIHRENGGLPTALNTGFATARGEYRTWTSSDNFTAPSWLAQLVKSLDAAPATVGFAASGFGLVDSMGRFSGIRRGQNLALESLIRINPGIASFLYRSRVAEQVGDYDASLLGAEDWDMWLRILEVCDPVYVDDVVYYYRQHRDSMTGTMPDKIRLAVQGTLESLRQRQGNSFDLNRFYPRLPRATDRRLARWQAKGRLATMLTDSPYCPANWTLGLYLEALRERFSPELHQNLLLLLALHGAWDLAISLLDQVAAAHPEPQRLAQIRALLAAHDDSLLKRFSLTLQEAGSLAFELGR